MKAINLLPPDQRGASKSAAPKAAVAPEAPSGIGAFVVLGALALCVVAFAAYVLTTNTVKDRQAQLEAATAHAEATTARVNQLKPYADFQALAETRIQTVKDLAASRFDWEQALRDISRAIPGDVTLSSLNGTISSGAGGGSSIRSAITSPAIELKGCTSGGQKRVAVLLSRLRNVDGVTRVSLGKSLKPESSGAGAVPATSGEAPACGDGRTPAFELVIFFEGSDVPESVEDITVQAAAGGAQGAGTTTPPADPADSGTATPASTPQGGGTE